MSWRMGCQGGTVMKSETKSPSTPTIRPGTRRISGAIGTNCVEPYGRRVNGMMTLGRTCGRLSEERPATLSRMIVRPHAL